MSISWNHRFAALVGAAIIGSWALPVIAQTASPGSRQRPPQKVLDEKTEDQTKPAGERGRRQQGDPGITDRDLSAAPDTDLQWVKDVVYAETTADDGSPVRLLMDTASLKRSDGKPMPVMIYVHGGGFVTGSREEGHDILETFARGGYFAVSVDYRLAGVAKHPAAMHDVKAAIRFIRANAESLVIDPERIGIWGHGIGGSLAAVMGTSGNTTDGLVEGTVGTTGVSSAVRAVAVVSAPANFKELRVDDPNTPLAHYFGGTLRQRKNDVKLISAPKYCDALDPPFLIFHGDRDTIVPYIQGKTMEISVSGNGGLADLVKIVGGGHVLPSKDVLPALGAFFDRELGGNVTPQMAALIEKMPEIGAGHNMLEMPTTEPPAKSD
ncbi:MAG: alpha/beta hydrolase [Phycisphaerales bacterium]|nr:alpha/beta hydrolase [Phycisphaerales bacterium]